MVVGAYGGITPEKRIPQLLTAVAAMGGDVPLHVLLVGQRATHYDVDAEIASLGLAGRVHIAGYVADEALPAHLAAADICWCLRWPSNREDVRVVDKMPRRRASDVDHRAGAASGGARARGE